MLKFVFFIVLIIYVIIGLIVTKFVKNQDDFYVMGERGSTLLIVGTLSATAVSSVTLMGIAGQAYSEGPLVISALGSFGAWIGMLISVLYVGRKMRAMKLQTVPEFFEKRFNSAPVSIVVSVIMIIGLLGYGIVDFIGAGLILSEVTGISFSLMIIIFTLAIMVFTVLGGMYGVIITDTVMLFTMLAVSLFIAPILIGEAGFDAIKNLSETVPGYLTLGGTEGRPLAFSISQFLVWILFFAVIPANISRLFPAKNDFVILKTGIIAVFLFPILQIPIYIAAAAMRSLDPNIVDPDKVMIIGFMNYTSSPVAGLAIAGIMAAIMSTASTVFILIGFALSRDLLERYAFKGLTGQQSLLLGRVTQTVVAIIACIIALTRPTAVYWISVYAGAFFAVGWFPTMFASFTWKRMNSKAAMASMLTGVGSFIVLGELMSKGIINVPFDIDALILAFILSSIVLVIVALTTKQNEYELRTFENIKNLQLNKDTINQFLSKPNGLAKLKSQYRQIIMTAIVLSVAAIVIWGFFIIKLA